VALTANPTPGSEPVAWTGCDQVTPGGECEVQIDAARSVNASFTLEKHQLTITHSGNGSGSVSSAPAGIDCGQTCSASFDHGTEVALTANPTPGSEPVAWTGCDQVTPSGECEVQIDAARSVNASFTLITPVATIGAHPPKRTTSSAARFAFSASQAGKGFLCRLDLERLKACHSPLTYRHLKPSRHRFTVIPLGLDGVAGRRATFRWRVLAGR
jgi:hypothetical protein